MPGDQRYHQSHFGKKGKRSEVIKECSSGDEDNDDKKQKLYEGNASGRQNDSYMGVFRLKKEGSHYRRIDFKSYPTQCYPFAVLSFTGSGNFNRSMRYFVDKIHGHLSDNSLRLGVSRDSKTNSLIAKSGRLVHNLKTERDIFDALKLPYYEPHERNYYLKECDRELMKNWENREKQVNKQNKKDNDEGDNKDDDDDAFYDVDSDDDNDNENDNEKMINV